MEYEILKDVTPFTLTLKKDDTTRHQVIYASQLYGTFFAVAAKLKIETGILSEIDLTLVNYKGLYNIGLLDLTKPSFDVDINGHATLKLHLSAMTGTHGNGKSVSVDGKNTPISKLSSMTVSRKLHPFGDNAEITDHLFDNFFDSEFYERDGAAILKKEHMDDMKQKTDDSFMGIESSKTGKCMKSTVIFI